MCTRICWQQQLEKCCCFIVRKICVVKLYSCKIFSYVFCVRKYFYNEKKQITVFDYIPGISTPTMQQRNSIMGRCVRSKQTWNLTRNDDLYMNWFAKKKLNSKLNSKHFFNCMFRTHKRIATETTKIWLPITIYNNYWLVPARWPMALLSSVSDVGNLSQGSGCTKLLL